MSQAIELLDVVALTADLPTHRLRRGQVGTVVEILASDVFEVEFSDDWGRTYAQAPASADQLLKLDYGLNWTGERVGEEHGSARKSSVVGEIEMPKESVSRVKKLTTRRTVLHAEAATAASKTRKSDTAGKHSESAVGSALTQAKVSRKETSKKVSKAASQTPEDVHPAKGSKSAAGSALSQKPSKKTTGKSETSGKKSSGKHPNSTKGKK